MFKGMVVALTSFDWTADRSSSPSCGAGDLVLPEGGVSLADG
jgi:hypothetical protein